MSTSGTCGAPRPAFPVPFFEANQGEFKDAAHAIRQALYNLPEILGKEATFDIELTTTHGRLLSYHHSAGRWDADSQVQNQNYLGSSTPKKLYAAGQLTQLVTGLAVERALQDGKIGSLDEKVVEYLPDLRDGHTSIDWDSVTLESLLDHSSGLPCEPFWSDLSLTGDLTDVGFPPLNDSHLPTCGVWSPVYRSCEAQDLLDMLKTRPAIGLNTQKNLEIDTNSDLLGLVIEKATGSSFEEFVTTSVLPRLGMDQSRFGWQRSIIDSSTQEHPHSLWGFDYGVSNPSRGLYTTPADMVKLAQHLLSRQEPAKKTLPWQVIETDKMLEYTTRRVKFLTKTSSIPQYASTLVLSPEYGIAIFIIVESREATKILHSVQDRVLPIVIRAADRRTQTDLGMRYTGIFDRLVRNVNHHQFNDQDKAHSSFHQVHDATGEQSMSSLNSTILIAHSLPASLLVYRWVSNWTDMLESLAPLYGFPSRSQYTMHLIFTGVYIDDADADSQRRGERWRMVPRPKGADEDDPSDDQVRFTDLLCPLEIDQLRYGGKGIDELIFWYDGSSDTKSRMQGVEIPAFEVTLARRESLVSERIGD